MMMDVDVVQGFNRKPGPALELGLLCCTSRSTANTRIWYRCHWLDLSDKSFGNRSRRVEERSTHIELGLLGRRSC